MFLLVSALAGACVMLLWLKTGDLFGFRRDPASEFSWSVFGGALGAGALAGAITCPLVGVVLRPLVSRTGGKRSRSQMRTLWALSSFPLAGGLILLLVGDFFLAGPAAYTSGESTTLQLAWGAISVAVGVSLDIWATFLLVKGLSVAAKVTTAQAIPLASVALVTLAFSGVVAGALVIGAVTLGDVLGAAAITR